MAITFPNNPTTGDEYDAENGIKYIWDGYKWTTEGSSNIDEDGYIESNGTTVTTASIPFAQGLTSAGNVGIGTNSPATPLHVDATVATPVVIESSNSQSLINFRNSSTNLFYVGVSDTNWNVQTSGSQRLSVTSSGNVGIGTDAPAYGLDINWPQARIGNGTSTGIIQYGSNTQANTNFHLGAASGVFRLWNGNIGAGTEILRVNNSGGVSWDNGANFLDDYEEGTFTPELESADGNFSAVYTTRSGKYTKIGNLVSVTGRIICSSTNSTGNALRVNGLPFNNVNSPNERASGSVGVYTGFGNSGSNRAPNGLLMLQNNNKADLQFYLSTTTTANVSGASCGSSGCSLFFSIQYFTGA